MNRTVIAASAAVSSPLLNQTQIYQTHIYSQYRRFHDWLILSKDIIKLANIGHCLKPG